MISLYSQHPLKKITETAFVENVLNVNAFNPKECGLYSRITKKIVAVNLMIHKDVCVKPDSQVNHLTRM